MLELAHGELLIEMGDNVYCKSNDRLFLSLLFIDKSFSSIPSIKLHSRACASPGFSFYQKGENHLENHLQKWHHLYIQFT